MPKLAPSCKRIFTELDRAWPHRDRRTDGWYADPKVRKSYGHNPGHNGYSHAVDVDKDGIDPMWIINHIVKDDRVLWYIIWNRKLYSNTYNFVPRAYTGKNPHTDHMHIEIYQTNYAEQWAKSWGIEGSDFDQPPHGPSPSPGGSPASYSGDFGANYGGRDYAPSILSAGAELVRGGNALGGYANIMKNIRR